jgi:DNA polymerase-1
MKTPHFVAIDTETTGLNVWRGDRMFCTAAWYPDGTKQYWRGEFGGLRELLADPSIDKVFANAKFDLRMLEWSGFVVKGQVWDIMILSYLLDGRMAETGLSLEAIARRYLPAGFRKVKTEIEEHFTSIGLNPNRDALNFALLPDTLVRRRCESDAELTGMFFQKAYSTVATVFPHLLDQEHRLLHVVKKMEDRGLCIDEDEIEKQMDYFNDIVEEVTDWMEGYTGQTYFSLTSRNDQLRVVDLGGFAELLWDKDPVTGRERMFLDDYHLRNVHHPAAAMLLVGKAAIKMRDTFLQQMLRESTNGVLHPSFNQCGTGTGRFSCSAPNLQNIPIEGDRRTAYTEAEANEATELTSIHYAPHIKRIFKVRPGYGHLHTDKKQAEMVMVAHYANDPVMKEIFASGQSIHDGLCRALYGEFTKGLKTRTKAVVFGFIYGAGLETLARKIGSDIAAARDARHRLERVLTALPKWKKDLIEHVTQKGYATTIHGRRHYISGSDSYKAVNYMCQGSVGDEIKGRMVALDDYFTSEGLDARVLLNIHDDVCTEFVEGDYEKMIPNVHRIMEESAPGITYNLPLPSSCDISYTRWADLLEIVDPRKPHDYSSAVVKPKALDKISKETINVYTD